MTILLFIIILAALIFVHELGHFIVAKLSGMKVSEFALGFPPRIFSYTYGETKYSLNLIPFGGYVKILGEDGTSAETTPEDAARSFEKRPRILQAAVLVAGITMNLLFAWLLISLGFMVGLPTSSGNAASGVLSNERITVVGVLPGSPAGKAGLVEGDAIVGLSSGSDALIPKDVPAVQAFIAAHGANEIDFRIQRGNEVSDSLVKPELGVVGKSYAVGIAMDVVGTLKLPFFSALWQGASLTVSLIKETAVGLYTFIAQAVTFRADLSQVTGPIGIVSAVGSASRLGFAYLISFAAFISINLAVLNLVPFPALDGGRLLFVAIEAVRRKPMKAQTANAWNAVGFSLLILLMIVVTVHDLFKIF